MSDGGKGDSRRPTDDAAYAEGWERIWGKRPDKTNALSSNGKTRDSNSRDPGSNPGGAAIYVDAETGAVVDEAWWPGMPIRAK